MRRQEPSQTAARVALVRAIETLLPEKRRLCSDPYAVHFLDEPMKRIYGSRLQRNLYRLRSHFYMPGVIGSVLMRTRFIDDYLNAALADGIKQLVILGAGYDTRAIRFAALTDGSKVYEVDHPATQQRKIAITQAVIGAPLDHVVYVPVRFNSEDMNEKLTAAGYCRDSKTVFIWEGVTYYISPRAADKTLQFVAKQSGAGSTIVFDYFPPNRPTF